MDGRAVRPARGSACRTTGCGGRPCSLGTTTGEEGVESGFFEDVGVAAALVTGVGRRRAIGSETTLRGRTGDSES